MVVPLTSEVFVWSARLSSFSEALLSSWLLPRAMLAATGRVGLKHSSSAGSLGLKEYASSLSVCALDLIPSEQGSSLASAQLPLLMLPG